jgi:Methyltransferase domain
MSGIFRRAVSRRPGLTLPSGYAASVASSVAYSRARERVCRICDSAGDTRTLRLDLLDAIRRVVGFDAYAWLVTDPETSVGCAPLADVPLLPELPQLIRLKYSPRSTGGRRCAAVPRCWPRRRAVSCHAAACGATCSAVTTSPTSPRRCTATASAAGGSLTCGGPARRGASAQPRPASSAPSHGRSPRRCAAARQARSCGPSRANWYRPALSCCCCPAIWRYGRKPPRRSDTCERSSRRRPAGHRSPPVLTTSPHSCWPARRGSTGTRPWPGCTSRTACGGDQRFDVILSTFGCMFAPRHEVVADEIARVLRPGGRVGICAWTPEGQSGISSAPWARTSRRSRSSSAHR